MQWHKLATLDTYTEGCSLEYQVGDHKLFVILREGEFYAYKNSCPHLGIELQWKENSFFTADGAYLECSMHGALFIPESGDCIAGPCSGRSLQALPIDIRQDGLYVML